MVLLVALTQAHCHLPPHLVLRILYTEVRLLAVLHRTGVLISKLFEPRILGRCPLILSLFLPSLQEPVVVLVH